VYRFLLSRHWLGLLAAALATAAACVALGMWQLDRLGQRHARNDLIHANLTAAPVPPDRLLAVGRDLSPDRQWRRVRSTGSFDEAHQILVRNRPLGGETGYHVLTPFQTPAGPALLVDRGWVPIGATARALPDVPPAPAGIVTVTGRLRPSEKPAGGAAAPAGQVRRIDVAGIARRLPYPVYGGYAELVSQSPRPGRSPTALPPPEPSEGPHLAYAVQWFMFACLALGAYVVLARREAEDGRSRAAARVPAPTGG
jgi:cytochrome oxidase assembly protein ShyY1